MKALQGGRKLYDALFTSVEIYRQRYAPRPAAPRRRELPAPGGAVGGRQLGSSLWISGGTPEARLWVLQQMVAQQLAYGRTAVVIQPEGYPILQVGGRVPRAIQSARDGTYDPLWGQPPEDACRLLLDAAVGAGLSPGEAAALTVPLRDELDYLLQRDGLVTLGAFARARSRELGEAAFARGDVRLAESHSPPEISSKLDWLRLHLRADGRPQGPGGPLHTALGPGAAAVVQLPQGEAFWAALALSQLKSLANHTQAGLLVVLWEVQLAEGCRALLEGLPGGRLLCYPDLPALKWLWQVAAAAAQAGAVLRHGGESARVLSSYFGSALREKPMASHTVSSGHCDSGGPMGLFTARTVTTSDGYSETYLWEPEIPERMIRDLGEGEGIFFCQNRYEICQIPQGAAQTAPWATDDC